MKVRKILGLAALLGACATAQAAPILTEGFDDVSTLGAAGWTTQVSGAPGWFQGNTGVFDAAAGAADSYIASNFVSADINGNVDNWLVTPLLSLSGISEISFATRTAGGFPGDNLAVYWNSSGSTNLADFVLLGSVPAAYPTDWTNFAFNVGLNGDARFAFRYTVTDTSVNGDYIGLDSVSVRGVPEPGTLVLFGAALLLLPLATKKRANRA